MTDFTSNKWDFPIVALKVLSIYKDERPEKKERPPITLTNPLTIGPIMKLAI